jgi:hypothetical protein
MIGKKFTSLLDGRIVEVKDAFEDIIILNDNSKLKTSRLMDKSYYEEFIDPSTFFQNQSLLNSFAQKIKQIPDEVLTKMEDGDRATVNESINNSGFNPKFDDLAILPADPELEKEELMRKYGIKNQTVQSSSPQFEAQRQMEKFQALLNEPEVEEDIIRVEVNQNYDTTEESERIIHREEKLQKNIELDPIISMFKNVKRNNDFKINIDIENKIPRADFIEMMEDSYNTSIIEFLADEFTQNILKNPDLIKDRIVDEIKKIVYGDKKIIEKTKEIISKKTTPKPRTRTKKITNTND